MKTMKLFGVVMSLGLLLGASGCKKDDPIAKMEGFANKLCACKDLKCAEGVQKEMTDWGSKQKDDKKKPSEADMKKIGDVMKKLSDCTAKLAGAAAPDAPK